MDYVAYALENHVLFNKEFREIMLERMEIESDFIISALENGIIVLTEAENATNGTDKKQKSFWQRLGEFFARIFGVFTEKTKGAYEANKRWMDENLNKLDKLDINGAKIEMIPFWNMSLDRLKSESSKLEKKFQSVVNNPKTVSNYKDIEVMKTKLLKEYLDENNSLTEGLKNFYRTGNPKGPLKLVTLEEADIKKLIPEFKAYCFNYQKDIVPFVEAQMNSAKSELQRIEKILNDRQKSVKESAFCSVENNYYTQTDLIYCENFVVLEADNNQNKDQKQQQDNNNNNNTTVKPTQVKVVNTNDSDQKAEDDANQTYKNMSNDQLVFMKNVMMISQTNITALMTVLEERFKAYLAVMKQLISEFSTKDTDNVNDNPAGMNKVDVNAGNNEKTEDKKGKKGKKI